MNWKICFIISTNFSNNHSESFLVCLPIWFDMLFHNFSFGISVSWRIIAEQNVRYYLKDILK